MKLLCECGSVIHDGTDYQENKAHFVPDESWEEMCEKIESGISPWDASVKYQRLMYQCYECARIYIEGESGNFYSFKPDHESKFGILKST